MKQITRRKDLFSASIERTCLAAILKYPDIIPDVATHIKPDFFYDTKHHSKIYSMILILFQEKAYVDKTILLERLVNIGLSIVNDLSISDYLDTFDLIPVRKDAILDYFAELYKYYYLRMQRDALQKARDAMDENLDRPLAEIVPKMEKILAEASSVIVQDDYKPTDLFGDMIEYIESRAESPREIGLITPFPIFNKKFAGLPFGDLYVIAAPPKMGKSTFLGYSAYGCAKIPLNNCKVFYADTELEGERVMSRLASSFSGVSEYLIKTGKIKNNKSVYERVKNTAYPEAMALKNKISHFYVENKSIEEIMSIFRRWYFTNVKKGENVLFIYDYLKLTGEKTSEHWKEYQIMGEKTDKIKKLVSHYPNTAGLVAVQINRMGDIAMASQIEWFASNIYKLLPKTGDEIAVHGEKWGTHKLIPHRTRIQGEDATGFNNFLEITSEDSKGNAKKEMVENFLNFRLDNFKVEECGTFEDILRSNAGQLEAEVLNDDEDFRGNKYELHHKNVLF